jgi:hypothetical protein
MESSMKHVGGCFCGAIRYRAEGTPESVTHCHCPTCRRVSGAAFVTWGTWPREAVAFTRGRPAPLESSRKARRGFCRRCGTPLTYVLLAQPGWIDLTVGSLDRPERVKPRDHTWTSSRLSWVRLADGLPAYRGIRPQPPPPPRAARPTERAPRRRAQKPTEG